MKKWLKRIGLVLLVAIFTLPISAVFANWLSSPAPIVTDLADGGLAASVLGINTQPEDN